MIQLFKSVKAQGSRSSYSHKRTNPSIHPSIHPTIHPSIHQSIHPMSFYSPTYSSIHQPSQTQSNLRKSNTCFNIHTFSVTRSSIHTICIHLWICSSSPDSKHTSRHISNM